MFLQPENYYGGTDFYRLMNSTNDGLYELIVFNIFRRITGQSMIEYRNRFANACLMRTQARYGEKAMLSEVSFGVRWNLFQVNLTDEVFRFFIEIVIVHKLS